MRAGMWEVSEPQVLTGVWGETPIVSPIRRFLLGHENQRGELEKAAGYAVFFHALHQRVYVRRRFVIVTLMKRRFVDDLHWLDEDEMLDMTAIAQSCPGAIAVNGAILVGQRVAGAAGIVVATIATIIPPMVILSLVSYFYALFADNPYVAAVLAGMQAGVAAVIVDVVLNLGAGVLKARRWLLNVIMVVAFVAAISGVNVIYIILTSGVIGVICAVMGRGKKAHAA